MSLEAVIPEGHSVGDVHLRPSEQRCSYEILNLPADTALEVRIHSSGWACTDGTAPGFAPDHETLQLARSETRLIDFASTCGGNPG